MVGLLPALRIAAVLAVLGAAGWLGFHFGSLSGDLQVQEMRVTLAEQGEQSAKALQRQAENFAERRASQATAHANAFARYAAEQTAAREAEHATAAALRSDNLRLRKFWTECAGQVPGPASADGAGRVDSESAGLRAAAAAAIVRIGAQCNAEIALRNRLLQADRAIPEEKHP